MVQYISNIIKMIGRRQWCYLAILSAFTFMGSGDAYHHDIEASTPVTTEQLSYLTLLENLSVFDQDLDQNDPIKTTSSRRLFTQRYVDFVHTRNQHFQTAFNDQLKVMADNPPTRIFSKKIPIAEEKEQLSNL